MPDLQCLRFDSREEPDRQINLRNEIDELVVATLRIIAESREAVIVAEGRLGNALIDHVHPTH